MHLLPASPRGVSLCLCTCTRHVSCAHRTDRSTWESYTPTTSSRPDLKSSERLAFWEGPLASIALGIHQNFLAPFAIFLRASAFQVGLLSAVAQLLTALAQFSASPLMAFFGERKRMIIATVLASAIPWVPIAAVGFLPSSSGVWILIPLAGAALALYMLSDPAWGSWISDIVPVSRRGRFLGQRSSLATLVTVCVGVGAALTLDILDNATLWGFVGVFLLACVARLVSAFMFSRMMEPPSQETQPQKGDSRWYGKIGWHSPAGRLTTYVGLLYFAVGVAGPFFAVYALRDLGYPYFTYIAINVASSIATVATLPLWGGLVDRRGNLWVLRIVSLGVSIVPLLWLVSPLPWYLVVMNVFGGAVWAGFNLATLNFVIGSSDEDTRVARISYFRASGALGAFAGAVVGGALATHVPRIFAHQLMTLFLLSGMLRLGATLLFVPKLTEPGQSRPTFGMSSLARVRLESLRGWALLRDGLSSIRHLLPH